MSCTIHLPSSLFFPTSSSTRTWRNYHTNPKPLHTQFKSKRRRSHSANVVSSSELPLLPFDISQVLIPSESKTLHLYEARYLALLEESLFKKENLFVHFVLDPIVTKDPSVGGASFAARYGCLVLVEKVDKLDVGALITIRGIGRVKIINFLQADPYLKGVVKPMQDIIVECSEEVSTKAEELKDALLSFIRLEIKLKVPKEELLKTHIANSLLWAENEPVLNCCQEFIPSMAERVSFAALQPVSGSSKSELAKLQQEKLRAMDVEDTLQRLNSSLEIVKQNVSLVAAKLAIQSIGVL